MNDKDYEEEVTRILQRLEDLFKTKGLAKRGMAAMADGTRCSVFPTGASHIAAYSINGAIKHEYFEMVASQHPHKTSIIQGVVITLAEKATGLGPLTYSEAAERLREWGAGPYRTKENVLELIEKTREGFKALPKNP